MVCESSSVSAELTPLPSLPMARLKRWRSLGSSTPLQSKEASS